jgi:hypothetical protein
MGEARYRQKIHAHDAAGKEIVTHEVVEARRRPHSILQAVPPYLSGASGTRNAVEATYATDAKTVDDNAANEITAPILH